MVVHQQTAAGQPPLRSPTSCVHSNCGTVLDVVGPLSAPWVEAEASVDLLQGWSVVLGWALLGLDRHLIVALETCDEDAAVGSCCNCQIRFLGC